MILFEKVTKRYGAKTVLDDVSLTIKPGEFVSLIGPSGAGKSTLIYSLIGAEKIDSGKIQVDDFMVHVMSERALQMYRRKIGVVFQDHKLLARKSVFENVAFALEACGYSKKYIDERVSEVLEIVGLAGHSDKFPDQLSGGEHQRTAIARALIHNPKLLVADEPTGHLDPDTASGIIDLLLKINSQGATILLATHNNNLVDKLQKRVVGMENGKIVRDESTAGYN